jgi:hypothetical protein
MPQQQQQQQQQQTTSRPHLNSVRALPISFHTHFPHFYSFSLTPHSAGTIMSYAKDSKSTDDDQRVADFNHFVIFDPRNLLACHDFKYIDLKPDRHNVSCHAHYTMHRYDLPSPSAAATAALAVQAHCCSSISRSSSRKIGHPALHQAQEQSCCLAAVHYPCEKQQ